MYSSSFRLSAGPYDRQTFDLPVHGKHFRIQEVDDVGPIAHNELLSVVGQTPSFAVLVVYLLDLFETMFS